MQSTYDISLIVSHEDFGADITGLLRSIARQTEGIDSLEVVVVGVTPTHELESSVWTDMAGGVRVLPIPLDEPSDIPAALNQGVEHATGDILVFPQATTRLDPHFLRTLHDVFSENTDVCYTDFIRISENVEAAGVVRLPLFDDRLLQVADFLGPCLALRRAAWERQPGFKGNTLYHHWDLRVRLAAARNIFRRVDFPLVTVDHHRTSFRERAEDGRAKAMVVINNQGYFHQHTVRWALSYLRGESWAEAGPIGVIASPMDVIRLTHDDATRRMGATALAEQAVRQFERYAVSND